VSRYVSGHRAGMYPLYLGYCFLVSRHG
jgi:hypothetical protein